MKAPQKYIYNFSEFLQDSLVHLAYPGHCTGSHTSSCSQVYTSLDKTSLYGIFCSMYIFVHCTWKMLQHNWLKSTVCNVQRIFYTLYDTLYILDVKYFPICLSYHRNCTDNHSFSVGMCTLDSTYSTYTHQIKDNTRKSLAFILKIRIIYLSFKGTVQ